MGTQEQLSTSTGLSELCLLAEKHGTDKLGVYTPFYDLLLSGRVIFKMLEVGIGTPEAMRHVHGYKAGASLRMWRDYLRNDFGPTDIYGIDISPSACAEAADGNIKTFCADSTNTEDILAAIPKLISGGKFDLIVDDGDHEAAAQLRTFQHLSPLLDSRGLYIIEDANDLTLLCSNLPEHTICMHNHKGRTGKLILIRAEAI